MSIFKRKIEKILCHSLFHSRLNTHRNCRATAYRVLRLKTISLYHEDYSAIKILFTAVYTHPDYIKDDARKLGQLDNCQLDVPRYMLEPHARHTMEKHCETEHHVCLTMWGTSEAFQLVL